MKYVIVYWTRFGNNKRIVDYLAKTLQGDVQVIKADEADPSKIPEADFYIFSSAAEKFTVQKDMRQYMKGLENMDQKKYGIINTHGSPKKNWLGKMEKILAKKNMVKVAETDFAIVGGMNEQSRLEDGWEMKLDTFMASIK